MGAGRVPFGQTPCITCMAFFASSHAVGRGTLRRLQYTQPTRSPLSSWCWKESPKHPQPISTRRVSNLALIKCFDHEAARPFRHCVPVTFSPNSLHRQRMNRARWIRLSPATMAKHPPVQGSIDLEQTNQDTSSSLGRSNLGGGGYCSVFDPTAVVVVHRPCWYHSTMAGTLPENKVYVESAANNDHQGRPRHSQKLRQQAHRHHNRPVPRYS